jgi:hypothetical protein
MIAGGALMSLRTGLVGQVRSFMSPRTCPPGQPGPRTPAQSLLRTVALFAWAALSGACGGEAASPVGTAQAFAAAVQRGDMQAVLPLLERAAAERLSAAAEQASDQVGGRRSIQPAEMLQIVDVPPTFELAQAELVDDDGQTAHVRLVGAQQESHTLTLVREDGAWHVRIPIPAP